jgi:hypothetical protein
VPRRTTPLLAHEASYFAESARILSLVMTSIDGSSAGNQRFLLAFLPAARFLFVLRFRATAMLSTRFG